MKQKPALFVFFHSIKIRTSNTGIKKEREKDRKEESQIPLLQCMCLMGTKEAREDGREVSEGH
jgi:hypothetical protein